VEQLAHVAKLPRTGERVTVNATDPLNLVGVIVPGANVPTVRTRHVVYVDGCPEGAEVDGAHEPVREAARATLG
jgi:ATP-dependent Lhr-like helicase